MKNSKRNTIYHSTCTVMETACLEGDHCRLRFHAPEIARDALPGQFVNVRYPSIIEAEQAFDNWSDLKDHREQHSHTQPPFLLARPFGVHRVSPNGWVEILFKALGRGTKLLAEAAPSTALDVLGPIGNSFDLANPPKTAILVAGGTGIAPLYLLADTLHRAGSKLVVLVGTGHAIPMSISDSEDVLHFLDKDVTAAIDDYVELGALVRIATMEPRPGCYTGTSVDLLEQYLKSLPEQPDNQRDYEIFSCGPWAMQARVAEIAKQANMPCQVLLEERMGCGLGACMACVCKVKDADNEYHNRRVCVDGPVFRAEEIGWNLRE